MKTCFAMTRLGAKLSIMRTFLYSKQVNVNGMRTFRPRMIRPRTIHPTDCLSKIVQKKLFNYLLDAGLMK